MTINVKPKLYPKNEAECIAKELQTVDLEWQYKVIKVDINYSIIKVIDEEGNIVGYWN